jgi:mRNA interferase YafQ
LRTIKPLKKFRKDVARQRSGKFAQQLRPLLQEVINQLAEDQPLPSRLADHALIGNWAGCRDCHIRPDLVLIYRLPDDETLELIRLGSHSQLGL